MKQRIIPDQLNELSSSQKIALRGWFLAKFPITRGGEIPWVNTKPPLPLMTIGQMIEFLSDKYENFIIGKIHSWYIDLDISDGSHDVYDIMELCDALWEAVKEELNK